MNKSLFRTLADWLQNRLAIRKLHALDDRLLQDLGTTRSDIARFVANR